MAPYGTQVRRIAQQRTDRSTCRWCHHRCATNLNSPEFYFITLNENHKILVAVRPTTSERLSDDQAVDKKAIEGAAARGCERSGSIGYSTSNGILKLSLRDKEQEVTCWIYFGLYSGEVRKISKKK